MTLAYFKEKGSRQPTFKEITGVVFDLADERDWVTYTAPAKYKTHRVLIDFLDFISDQVLGGTELSSLKCVTVIHDRKGNTLVIYGNGSEVHREIMRRLDIQRAEKSVRKKQKTSFLQKTSDSLHHRLVWSSDSNKRNICH